jgi:hypothetical protein
MIAVVISREGAVDHLWAERADRLGDRASDGRLVQRNRTVGKAEEAVIEPQKVSDPLCLALPADIGGRRVQRDEQREHLAAKTPVQSEVAADRDNLIVGMGGHDQYTLLLDCTKLDRHSVRDAVNAAEKTRSRVLEYAVQE